MLHLKHFFWLKMVYAIHKTAMNQSLERFQLKVGRIKG